MTDDPIPISWTAADDTSVAVAPDLPGCSASGETVEEAAREAQAAQGPWLEAARANDFPIPSPTVRPTLADAAAVGFPV